MYTCLASSAANWCVWLCWGGTEKQTACLRLSQTPSPNPTSNPSSLTVLPFSAGEAAASRTCSLKCKFSLNPTSLVNSHHMEHLSSCKNLTLPWGETPFQGDGQGWPSAFDSQDWLSITLHSASSLLAYSTYTTRIFFQSQMHVVADYFKESI